MAHPGTSSAVAQYYVVENVLLPLGTKEGRKKEKEEETLTRQIIMDSQPDGQYISADCFGCLLPVLEHCL